MEESLEKWSKKTSISKIIRKLKSRKRQKEIICIIGDTPKTTPAILTIEAARRDIMRLLFPMRFVILGTKGSMTRVNSDEMMYTLLITVFDQPCSSRKFEFIYPVNATVNEKKNIATKTYTMFFLCDVILFIFIVNKKWPYFSCFLIP